MRTVLSLVLLLGLATTALADRFFVERRGTLYVATAQSKEVRKVVAVAKPTTILWAVLRDGHRVVYGTRMGEGAGMMSAPLVVMLSDITGSRQKTLFQSDRLKDRQGNPISEVAPLTAEASATTLAEWEPTTLAWGADGRTLYISCRQVSDPTQGATLAVDGVTGAAFVDAKGRWKVVAPFVQVDTRPKVLAGIGKEGIGVVNVAEGVTQFFNAAGATPAYEMPLALALSPDAQTITFTGTGGGLWGSDVKGTSPKRWLSGEVKNPRWRTDGKAVFFLAPRPTVGDTPTYDLFELALKAGVPQGTPRLLVENVEWFDVATD
jgi:hypothetical protein